MDITDSVKSIKGIGEKKAADLARLQIRTVKDLLEYYPRGYETYELPVTVRQSSYRDFAAVEGVLMQTPVTRYVKQYKITTTMIRDQEGTMMELSWFNMPYLSKTLKPGVQYVFRGKIGGYGALRKMQQPQIIKKADYTALTTTLQPVYPLTKGVTKKAVSDAVRAALDEGYVLPETLSEELKKDYGLMDLQCAVREIHFPQSKASVIPARRRLVFEEFYRFIVNVRRMKEAVDAEPNTFVIREKEETDRLVSSLPYQLTGAQERVLHEIRCDLSGSNVMNRLVQGDVGSGKTIVAFLAMYETALNGWQSALMAPTEVLARQHYDNFRKLSDQYGLGLSIELLTGSMSAKEKREAYERIATHRTDIVVGTHALIQEKAHYEDLALVITDEQHRFGVSQRRALSEKGRSPHVLVMSATPIPRTLALILYGDMDISVMDELPKNRLPVKNAVVDIGYRGKAYSFIRKQVDEGHQAYVICPMVEESETSEGENVEDYAKVLRQALPPYIRVEFLHGKMKNDEKEALMSAFSKNEIQVLVSTTVIEVGIDVPNATVIMIENAERFGLAQLHQLRGRVGRGNCQSYCIMVDTTVSEESKKRLQVLNESNDGFFIASEDLKMRGPGDFFGLRQSGDIAFRMGDIYTDAAILKQAEEAAEKTLSEENVKGAAAVL
ncbi:MAG: ATP-dependent DNA helicase RecG [Lachnospiraceae bacterium]|nr:ATP-dependent DNA helicase RecG [Lachnospiraceae bacterium]